jgi:hypothetical protein
MFAISAVLFVVVFGVLAGTDGVGADSTRSGTYVGGGRREKIFERGGEDIFSRGRQDTCTSHTVPLKFAKDISSVARIVTVGSHWQQCKP